MDITLLPTKKQLADLKKKLYVDYKSAPVLKSRVQDSERTIQLRKEMYEMEYDNKQLMKEFLHELSKYRKLEKWYNKTHVSESPALVRADAVPDPLKKDWDKIQQWSSYVAAKEFELERKQNEYHKSCAQDRDDRISDAIAEAHKRATMYNMQPQIKKAAVESGVPNPHEFAEEEIKKLIKNMVI